MRRGSRGAGCEENRAMPLWWEYAGSTTKGGRKQQRVRRCWHGVYVGMAHGHGYRHKQECNAPNPVQGVYRRYVYPNCRFVAACLVPRAGVFRKDGIKKGEKPKSATATTATTAESSTGELATGSRRSLLGKQARNSKLPKDCGLFPNGVGLPDTLPPFPLNGPWPDIFPGCDPENPIAFTFAEWQDMAMDATKALPNFQLMYNYGAKDAELWIKNQTGTRKL